MESPPTPYLRIDAWRVERNQVRLAAYGTAHGLRISPHTKTHKSIVQARSQLDHGAAGLTVAKPGEAEVMAQAFDGHPGDLEVAYPVLDPRRAAALASLARERPVRVALDSRQALDVLAEAARQADTTFGILTDLDVGMHRTGVGSTEALLELAQHADRLDGLRVDGIFCYYGHVSGDADQRLEQLQPVIARLEEAVGRFQHAGLSTDIVSGGSTPTIWQSHQIGPVNEIRPGTYIYNDINCVRQGVCELDDCAAHVVATVVSANMPGQVVLDAGSKTLTSDPGVYRLSTGFGIIREYPEATITKLSEEHGVVDVSASDRQPEIGEQVTILPNHICVVVNMFDTVWIRQADDAPFEPLPIEARGKVS